MEIAEIFGYLVGLIVGVVMGLIGGGGSLLFPVFVYLFQRDIELSSGYTLILVGLTACFGAYLRRGRREVDFRVAVTLAIPVLLGTLLVRGYLIHAIPDTLFSIAGITVTKRLFILIIFSVMLLLSFASIMGFIGKNLKPNANLRFDSPWTYYGILIGSGVLIGIVSGLIGAGGGVLIVPLLIVVFGLPVKTVVGTSLVIMAVKSIIGFLGDIFQNGGNIEIQFLVGFALIMFAGIYLGSMGARKIPAKQLRIGFAWFILGMAVFILVKELMFPLPFK